MSTTFSNSVEVKRFSANFDLSTLSLYDVQPIVEKVVLSLTKLGLFFCTPPGFFFKH